MNKESKEIFIWGVGRYGLACYEFHRSNGVLVSAFIDNDTREVDYIYGLSVFSPQIFFKDHADELNKLTIIIAVYNREKEIRAQIKQLSGGFEFDVISYETSIKRLLPPREELFGTRNNYSSEGLSLLYDHQIFYSQEYGGISRYFSEIISRLLHKNKVSVSLFEGIYRCRYDLKGESNRFNEYYGESIEKYTNNISVLIPAINNILLKEFTAEKKYKVYHPTYYGDMRLACYDNMVLTVHDLIYELYGLDPSFCEIMRSSIKKADYIVAVSEHTKSDLINLYGIDENRIRVIYHGNSLRIDVVGDRVEEAPYFLYVGQREGYKNASSLMKSFANLSHNAGFKLVFFGGGGFSIEEKQLLADLRIEQDVYQISGDDKLLANLYKYAEAFIYPSKYEGFGIPILEAMYYGTPVVTSKVSSMPEVAGDAALYVDPDDTESIMDAMNLITMDSDLRTTLGQKGIEREKLFSWDIATEQLCDYYIEISS